MLKFPCRCKRCGHRRTFRMHPEAYTVRFRWLIRCDSCGFRGKQPGDLPWYVDWYRKHKEHRRVLCTCDRWPYPHRRGCKFCTHYAGEVSDDEAEAHFRDITNAYRR